MKKEHNIAYIDGQNLFMGTSQEGWSIDHKKFRIYLLENYGVKQAYYFLGYLNEDHQGLFDSLQEAGFIVKFREHASSMLGQKKRNVDTDIVFEMMKRLIDHGDNFDQIVLVSGDGDYKKAVDYLISKNRFRKILFPNYKFASSLYKKLGSEFFDNLQNVRVLVEYTKEKEKGS